MGLLECPHNIAIAFSQRELFEDKDTEREKETERDRDRKNEYNGVDLDSEVISLCFVDNTN